MIDGIGSHQSVERQQSMKSTKSTPLDVRWSKFKERQY